jgi:hypothetical protein
MRSSGLACVGADAWDEDDLIARLCGALDFAACAVRELGACADDMERPAGVERERLVAETARLLLAASHVESYAAVGPRVLRVASLLVPHARSQRVLRAICLEPAMALEHAAAHICLNRLGYYDPDFDAALDLSVASAASGGHERVPHRMLEQEWLKQGWLYPEGLPKLKAGAQMAHCVLSRTMDLLAGSSEDVRSFARALMCLRDFNLFPRPLPRAREALLAEAEGMLERCLEQEDYALAAEVLLAWPLTGEIWSAAAAFGFRVVMGAQCRKSVSGEYAAIYGMGILCAACLAPGRRPPVRVAAEGARGGVFGAIFDCVDTEGLPERWVQELAGMEAKEREPLAELVLGIGLQREFRRREFAAMERLLAVAKGLGLGGSPVAVQAGEMMARVASCGLASPVPSAWGRRELVEVRPDERVAEVSYQTVGAA